MAKQVTKWEDKFGGLHATKEAAETCEQIEHIVATFEVVHSKHMPAREIVTWFAEHYTLTPIRG